MEEQIWKIKIPSKQQNQAPDLFLSKTHLFSLGSPSCSLSWTSKLQVYGVESPQQTATTSRARWFLLSKFEVWPLASSGFFFGVEIHVYFTFYRFKSSLWFGVDFLIPIITINILYTSLPTFSDIPNAFKHRYALHKKQNNQSVDGSEIHQTTLA